MLELEDDSNEYETEEIRGKRIVKGKAHYLIK